MSIGIQWPLLLFTLIAGAGYGILTTVGIARLFTDKTVQTKLTRKVTLITCLILIIVGALMSIFHLSHPERFMGAIANLFSFSGIAIELIGVALCVITAVLFLIFSYLEKDIGEKVCAVLAIIFGLVASFMQGVAYSNVGAQAGWTFTSLPFSYLLTSFAAGLFIYLLIASVTDAEKNGLVFIGKITVVVASLSIISLIIYTVNLAMGNLLQGSALFSAIAAIIFGIITLAVAWYFSYKDPSKAAAIVGTVVAICAGLFVRMLMWLVASYGFNLFWEATVNRGVYPLQ